MGHISVIEMHVVITNRSWQYPVVSGDGNVINIIEMNNSVALCAFWIMVKNNISQIHKIIEVNNLVYVIL